MKKKKKFKNVSLYCKPVNSPLYFCITATLIGIIGRGFLVENLSPSFLYSFFSYLWSAVILFGIIRLWLWYRKQRFYIKLEKNLYFFLQSYNLCQTEIIDREKVVSNSAVFGYLLNDTEIIIRAYKQGDIYTDKMNQFDTSLSALLGLPLENKIDTISYCDYIFSRYKDRRIIINHSNAAYNNTTILPLSNNLAWNILKQPHLLLAGVTGSGKTTFLNYLIIEMKKMQADIYICDPKRSDLASLKSILGAEYVASDVNNIAKLSRIVKEKMEQRFIDYKENADHFVYGYSFVDYKLNPIFILFDELGAFRASADKKVFAETMANLTEVILKGREMGVFCVLSTQQPNANNIPTELRDNLSVRIALGNMSSEAYRMVFGEDIKDLSSISAVGGGYIYLDGLGWSKPKSFEAPYLDYKKFNFIEELKKYQQNISDGNH
ncbi:MULTISPECIES: FtsK/SpoIIIE domain-containing protein [Agathobaculum]|uniref:FtsK/SpoIIIE domain-containing protein n=1 Tax=Agathobaculum TaxID=2048137 RepID=UPI0035669DB8